MITRMRKAMEEKDQGFTLIELLVVIIIIGILAAIAIPLFLNQRRKAEDSAAKADVSTIGKEVATYFVDWDGTNEPVIALNAGGDGYTLAAGSGGTATPIGNKSTNVAWGGYTSSSTSPSTTWCVYVTNPEGDKAVTGFEYSAAGGLAEGRCGTTAPTP